MVGCGNVILSSVRGQLTTSKTCTCTQSSSPIALCAMHRNCRLEEGSHPRGNWETIGYTSKRWDSHPREMRQRDGKQVNIWKIEWLEPQKASSGTLNASHQWLLSYLIFFILSILVCMIIWWTRSYSSSNNNQGSENLPRSGWWCLHILALLHSTGHIPGDAIKW